MKIISSSNNNTVLFKGHSASQSVGSVGVNGGKSSSQSLYITKCGKLAHHRYSPRIQGKDLNQSKSREIIGQTRFGWPMVDGNILEVYDQCYSGLKTLGTYSDGTQKNPINEADFYGNYTHFLQTIKRELCENGLDIVFDDGDAPLTYTEYVYLFFVAQNNLEAILGWA
jgi:hypothetical protein